VRMTTYTAVPSASHQIFEVAASLAVSCKGAVRFSGN